MGPDLEKALNELSLRMRLLRALQEDKAPEGALSERESLILQQLSERESMNISQIAEAWPDVSESTISMTITKLWREKGLVTKTINPDNQRVTLVQLSEKGRQELERIFQQRNERFQALFDGINVTEEERQALIRICTRGVEFFDKMLGFSK